MTKVPCTTSSREPRAPPPVIPSTPWLCSDPVASMTRLPVTVTCPVSTITPSTWGSPPRTMTRAPSGGTCPCCHDSGSDHSPVPPAQQCAWSTGVPATVPAPTHCPQSTLTEPSLARCPSLAKVPSTPIVPSLTKVPALRKLLQAPTRTEPHSELVCQVPALSTVAWTRCAWLTTSMTLSAELVTVAPPRTSQYPCTAMVPPAELMRSPSR